MDGIDQLWWRAPGLALRFAAAQQPHERSAGPATASTRDWQINPAATAWATQRGLRDDHWPPLAAAVRAQLDAGQTQGRATMAGPGIEFSWTAVPLGTGWLIWLEAAGEVERLTRRLDMVQTLSHMASWERDLTTGDGRWDAHMYGFLGLDPAEGMPRTDANLQLVHPDDRARLQAEYSRFAQAAGRYETHYRIVTPAGVVKDVRALCEVENGPSGTPARITGLMIDETEIADRLRTSEATAALWVRAVDLAAVALWRLDLLNQRVYFSDWGYTMLGLDPVSDKLTVEQLRDLIHPDDRAAVVAAAEEAIRTRGVVDVEARYLHRSGHYRNLYTRRVAEYDANGNATGLSGVTIDMTEQIAERERAQAYALRIDRVTNAAGVGIWSVDIETRQVEWNEQMYRLYGLSRDTAPPTNDAWLQLVHPEDREIARNHRPVIGTGPQGLHAEFRIVRPNGAVRWVASWSRREVLGSRELAFGVNLDITNLQRTQAELRQTQERARLATESAGIGTWERDLRTGRAKWDAQMYRLRGLPVGPETPPDDMRYAAYHPDDLENINRNKARAGKGGDNYENEFRVVFPDGSIRWLATRGLVKRDAQGDPERMLGVSWDITERRRAEQALREKAAAVQASAAKSQFLARMSHELRTPLNAVLGFAQLMGNDVADRMSTQQRQRVDRIHSAGLHLLALIDDVLDLATIESDALPLTYETVSLQASLDDVLQWTQLQASQASVQIHAQSLRGWVRADPRRVRQILSNLISNAIKYNRPQGQVWIACNATTHRDQPAWTLAVRDTGRGLSGDQCEQLFQPFNRLGAERGTIPGTGIGLAIVHHLVRLMGGDVTVSSEPGRGSEFCVTLPAERPPETTEREPLTAFHTDLGDDPAAARGSNVLYIEDNPVNVILVQELVALRPDVSLSVAVDGLSGVSRAVADSPHVVLVDMQLPDIDGFEVLRRLKAQPMLSDMTIVALSANAMPEDVNRAKQAGFDDYWTKPIDFHAFLRNLTRLAQSH